MASKKREIQLQAVINSQSLWDEMMQNKGLTELGEAAIRDSLLLFVHEYYHLLVIDVYQAWCGPCKAMQTLFRKLKNELNEDELLHFAVAEADSVVTLQPFRDKCEPVFLFSVNGTIVSKIHGANAPLVNQKIITLVNEERKIAAGEMVRPQYHEIMLVDSDSEDAGELSYESADQIYTIVIIKPDAVAARKVQEIKEKSPRKNFLEEYCILFQRSAYKEPDSNYFQAYGAYDLCHRSLTLPSSGEGKKTIIKAGFVIEAEDKKPLTEEQVKHFYSQIVDQPDFEDFVSFMTRNLSYILVVSQGKEKQPSWDESEVNSETESKESWDDQQEMAKPSRMKGRKSLQQYLEIQQISQFCDVEENITNTKFIDVLIPDFKRIRGIKFEKILALLLPALVNERTEDVLNKIQDEGFKILLQRQIVLSEEEAKTLCKEYENKDYFGNVIENMTSGPSLALVLVRENGLGYWKQLIGPSSVEEAKEYIPESLCAQFAIEGLPINPLYGSDSLEAAEREIQYFFPPQHTVALIKPHVTQEQREDIMKVIKETGFDITQMKEILLTEEEAEKIYFKIKRKTFYKDVLGVLAEGASLVMILTKWNAVSDWRRLMGPTDPEEARLLSPDSIRAQFGENILKNAVHGASNMEEAMEIIGRMFEDFVPEKLEEN